MVIFTAMKNLAGKKSPIDLVTVKEELESMTMLAPIGGPVELFEIADILPDSD
ncbi:protein of unknown function (plasmid) [Pseudodesulfovibrio profundus]|uniref:DNA helicase DnaB-like N-terminal domain-containing protein n=2 Tax=Pseudodesulfovibrio profundus TaxID=57320 RepID=A0A2C8FG67_9BACT|nr:protein of unknown function [Pseudodesulfovibrio profundus]